jgi:hypothetical protein
MAERATPDARTRAIPRRAVDVQSRDGDDRTAAPFAVKPTIAFVAEQSRQ